MQWLIYVVKYTIIMDAMGYDILDACKKYIRVDIMHLNSCNSMKHLCYFLFSTPRWFFLDFDRDTEYRKDPC